MSSEFDDDGYRFLFITFFFRFLGWVEFIAERHTKCSVIYIDSTPFFIMVDGRGGY